MSMWVFMWVFIHGIPFSWPQICSTMAIANPFAGPALGQDHSGREIREANEKSTAIGTVPKCGPNSLVPPSFQTLRLWKNHPVISGISLRTQLRRSLIICWWQNGSSELQMPKNGLPDFVMGPSMKASFT